MGNALHISFASFVRWSCSLAARPRIVIDNDTIIPQPPGDVVWDIDSKWYGYLRHERLVHITVRDPNHLPGVVVVGRQNLRDVDGATTLIHQFALQNFATQSVFANCLVADRNHRIGA